MDRSSFVVNTNFLNNIAEFWFLVELAFSIIEEFSHFFERIPELDQI